MFKSKLIIILLCLCVVAGIANAQEKKPQVIQSEPQLEDIYNVLEAMDIHMFRFELKEFLNKVYTVTVYMDEYENGKSPKQVHNIRLGKNIQSLNAVPENIFRKARTNGRISKRCQYILESPMIRLQFALLMYRER